MGGGGGGGGGIGEEEDDADSWQQAEASCFPHRVAKRRALDLVLSQASSSARPINLQASCGPNSALSQASSAPDPTVSHLAQRRAGSSLHREWWSTELGAPVQIGVDFVPDTQQGGGDEFIFVPNSGGFSEGVDDAERARAKARGREKVEHLRQLFPPLPSLTDQLRDYVKSCGGRSDHLLVLCGINPTASEGMVDHGLDAPSSNTWSGSMLRSSRLSPVPGTDLSCAPYASEPPFGPPPAGSPSSTSTGGLLRSSNPTVASSSAWMSSSSISGRSNAMMMKGAEHEIEEEIEEEMRGG